MFYCDAQYSPTYNYPNKRLLLLQWDGNDTNLSENAFIIDPHPLEKVQEPGASPGTKLSLKTMSSTNISGTMHFIGSSGGQLVKILLDCGGDDTFL